MAMRGQQKKNLRFVQINDGRMVLIRNEWPVLPFQKIQTKCVLIGASPAQNCNIAHSTCWLVRLFVETQRMQHQFCFTSEEKRVNERKHTKGKTE